MACFFEFFTVGQGDDYRLQCLEVSCIVVAENERRKKKRNKKKKKESPRRSFADSLVAEKSKDPKPGTPDKKKQGTTRPGSNGDDNKSPRNGSADSVGDAAAAAASQEEVMVFNLGEMRLALTHRKLLQDQVFYDLELLQVSGKKTAPTRAHRAVLQVRCPALLQEGKFISKIDKKKDRWSATILETALPTLTPNVLSQLMVYVYGGAMEVARFTLPTLLDMCAVGGALSLEEIVWVCEHKVRELLSIDTVHSILKGAEDRNLGGVKNFALQYAFDHWKDFIGNTEGAKILGLELFQDVSARYAKGEKTAYPEGPQPQNTIVSDYRRLYEEMLSPDLQLEVGGEKLNCHRAILAMYSDGLAARFQKVLRGVGQMQSVRLIDEADGQPVQSVTAVTSFLRFVYYGETKMDPIDACEMIHKVNTFYRLNTFQLLCEHTIVNNINQRSVLPILGVTYIKGFDAKAHIQALRKQALAFVIAHFGTVELAALSAMPPEIRTDLLVTLQLAFQQGRLGKPAEPGAIVLPAAHAHSHNNNADHEVAVAVEDSE